LKTHPGRKEVRKLFKHVSSEDPTRNESLQPILKG
jgi:hypothetical protein